MLKKMALVLIFSLILFLFLFLRPKFSFAEEKEDTKIYYLIRVDEDGFKSYSSPDSGESSGWLVNSNDSRNCDKRGFTKPILHVQKEEKKK
jgi:hypothetical protein